MEPTTRGLAARAGAMAALLLVASAMSAWAQASTNPYGSREDVAAGSRLFRAHCGRCHGRDAAGDIGPDLTRGRFRRAQTDAGLFRVISEGVPDTQMPPMHRARTDRSVWQVVAYLRSLNLRPEDVSLPGDPARGAQLYRDKGRCDSCHMLGGSGGLLGPDLTLVGERRSPAELELDMRRPDAEVLPRWWTMRVTLADGTAVEGLRMDEDTYSMRLMDAEENLWSLAKRDLRSMERLETSTMPGYEDELTPDEIDDLVAYLFARRREEQ